jgi:hypothetical protein
MAKRPWYLLAIVLSVLLWYTDCNTPLVSFGHCVVWSSMIYRFWLPLGIFWPLCCLFFYDIQILITSWYLLVIVLSESVYHRRTDNTIAKRYQGSNQNLYIIEEQTTQWPKDAIVLSVLLWYTDSDYPLGILWPLCCLIFYDIQILITPWYFLAQHNGQKIPRV